MLFNKTMNEPLQPFFLLGVLSAREAGLRRAPAFPHLVKLVP